MILPFFVRPLAASILLSLCLYGQDAANPRVIASGRKGTTSNLDNPVINSKIDDSLMELSGSPRLVEVFIVLREQPQEMLVKRHLEPVRAEIEALHAQVTDKLRTMSPANESVAKLVAQRDRTEVQARIQAVEEIRRATAAGQDAIIERLKTIGAVPGRAFWIFNMISARVPGGMIPAVAEWPEVGIIRQAHTRTPMVGTSVPSTGVGTFWEAGYTGGTQTVLVMDSGINASHPWFAGLQIEASVSLLSASKRECFDDDATDSGDLLGHGTAVSGILASRAGGKLGMLPGLGRLVSVKVVARAKVENCPKMLIEEADWIAAAERAVSDYPVQVVNLSFGGNPGTEDDLAAWVADRLADLFDLSIVAAAGNDGSSPRIRQVSSPAVGWNVTAAANIDANRTETRLDDRVNSNSSRGPTPSGRHKPDIGAPGTLITSAGKGGDEAEGLNGTSYAAPHVAGGFALLADAGLKRSLDRRAVLINSTDSAVWTEAAGFGSMNLAAAFKQRDSVFYGKLRLRQPENRREVFLYRGDLKGSVRTTLVWNRHIRSIDPAANRASWYLTNLNVTGYTPNDVNWSAVSGSDRDNTESLSLEGTAPVVFKVDVPPNTVVESDEEPFAIAFSDSGFKPVKVPALDVSCVPERDQVMVFGTLPFQCSIRNTGELGLPRNGVTQLYVQHPWTERVGTIALPPVDAGKEVKERVLLDVPNNAPPRATTFRFGALSNAYGEQWMSEGSRSFQVVPAALQDCTSEYKVNARFPLSSARQTFVVNLSFPKYNPDNPGHCSWTADPASGSFVSVVNAQGSDVSFLSGAGSVDLTFKVPEAPRNTQQATRSSTVPIRITSSFTQSGAPAPKPLTDITFAVTQNYTR